MQPPSSVRPCAISARNLHYTGSAGSPGWQLRVKVNTYAQTASHIHHWCDAAGPATSRTTRYHHQHISRPVYDYCENMCFQSHTARAGARAPKKGRAALSTFDTHSLSLSLLLLMSILGTIVICFVLGPRADLRTSARSGGLAWWCSWWCDAVTPSKSRHPKRARVYIVKALVAPSVVVRVERARPNNYGFINRVIEHALLFSSRWCCVQMEGWDVVARAHVRAFATSSAPRSRFVFKHYQMVDAIIRNLEVCCFFLCIFFGLW